MIFVLLWGVNFFDISAATSLMKGYTKIEMSLFAGEASVLIENIINMFF